MNNSTSTISAFFAPIKNSSIPYIIGTSARLVVKLTVTDGGTDDDTLELFVNQNTEGTPDASASYTLDDFTQITHRAGNGFGEATLVNLIVADDFASAATVVPEPSSSALLGLAGCALILRRRNSSFIEDIFRAGTQAIHDQPAKKPVVNHFFSKK